jgi:antitoxin MazE
MHAKIQKWGNSLAIRIPKILADETGLNTDKDVEIRVVDGQLHIIPIQDPHYDLDTLLDAVTPDNLHGEIDMGKPVGKEAW